MTLITNEIHLLRGIEKAFIICTADRRLTFDSPVAKKDKYRSGKKLFKIEYLNASVSYWGNFYITDGNKVKMYSEWLPHFIQKHHDIKTLKEFAWLLREKLNRGVRVEDMMKRGSGFHLCGFNSTGQPEFIHFSNCNWNGTEYHNLKYVYKEPYEDFRLRDALKFGGNDIATIPNSIKGRSVYRNGDLKVHEAAWTKLDEMLEKVFKDEAFKTIATLHSNDLTSYIEFKLKFIGSVYKNFAFVKGVGAPFDVLILKQSPNMQIDDFTTVFMKPT